MKKKDYKYTQVYSHFKKLIEEGEMSRGDKMPSLITCSRELSVSKTTAENAYFQLAADGYIISRERSGYYVTGRGAGLKVPAEPDAALYPTATAVHAGAGDAYYRAGSSARTEEAVSPEGADLMSDYELSGALDAVYDMARMGDDPSAFRFDLWQRYIKSAIRRKDRMVTYGEPQGETELREAISEYVRRRRNIYCSPERIVIGASTQSLLTILLPMLKGSGVATASVPARGFERYAQVFHTHDLKVDIRSKDADIIYVSPSHMTVWGEVMTLKRRYEVLDHSRKGHLIIEDDYQNEFIFSKQGCPSIYSLSGGEHVVYLGSFSRLLLPSIRISFMILPTELLPLYKLLSHRYDQTASKIEQLALCSYLRDDHMYRQIKKLRKTYAAKRNLLQEILTGLTEGIPDLMIRCGDCGTEMAVYGKRESVHSLTERLERSGIVCRKMNGYSDEERQMLLFSCGMIEYDRMKELADRIRTDRQYTDPPRRF